MTLRSHVKESVAILVLMAGTWALYSSFPVVHKVDHVSIFVLFDL